MDGYLLWLLAIVCSNEEIAAYSMLFEQLYETSFFAVIARDDDRRIDALALKRYFVEEHGLDQPAEEEPSVLEVLVAFSQKLDEVIGDEETCPGKFFWYMLSSIGLLSFKNDCYNSASVERKLKRFMERRYNANGDGGCCYFPLSTVDLTKIDMWYQWMWYMSSQEEE